MRGAFVSNGFLKGGKFSQPADMLCAAAGSMGIEMDRITNDSLAVPIGEAPEYDFVLFWDKDVACAANLELSGIRVFNTSECISVCDDKAMTHLALANAGVDSIDTIVCPMAFSGYDRLDFAGRAVEKLGFPMVVKDRFGSFGEQVHLVKDMGSLMEMLGGPYVPRIMQRYIPCNATDIRAEVVGGEVVAAVQRHGPEGDFRSNTTIGGRMERLVPSSDVVEIAMKAAEAVKADFAGIDIIMDDDSPRVCEVNSNAHIWNLRNCTGRDVSYDILEHVVRTVG